MSTGIVENLNPQLPLTQSRSCLEFLLLSFCHHFQLKPKQAAGLLTQGGKYLAYVIAKGFKGKHATIVAWFQDLFTNVKHLAQLIELEEAAGSVPLMLASLQAGLVSKHLDSAVWCSRLFSKLATEFLEYELLPSAWDWFVSEGGGLESCLLAYNRYGPDIKSQVVSVLVQFGKGHFVELFTLQLRTALGTPLTYFATMNEFLPTLCETRTAKQELLSAGIAEYWLDLGIREAEGEGKDYADLKLAAVNFVSDVWVYLPLVLENNDHFAASVLTALTRGARDRLVLMRMACLGKLFQLLEVFSEERIAYAPVVYKTLTFALVENFSDVSIREFILSNFKLTFDGLNSIPVGILINPLVKQLRVSPDIELGLVDFEFFQAIADHPRLTLRSAVPLLDVLSKVCLKESNVLAVEPVLELVARFLDASALLEYLNKLLSYAVPLLAKSDDANQSQVLEYLLQNLLALEDPNVIELVKTQVLACYHGASNQEALQALLKIMNTEAPKLETPERKPAPISKKSHSGFSASVTQVVPRVFRDIERVKMTRIEKEKELKEKERQEKAKQERRKRVLKKQLEKRKLDQQKSVLETAAYTHVSVPDDQTEGIGIVCKRYQRVLSMVFKKHAKSEKNGLTSAEATRLLKEHALLPAEECAKIVKGFSQHLGRTSFSYQDYLDFILQAALWKYSQPLHDLTHLPACISLKTLVLAFKQTGVPSKLFEVDCGPGDKETLARLQKQLRENPHSELPVGYKKVAVKDVEVWHSVPAQTPENTALCLELMDDLLFKRFGTHILEPTVQIVTKHFAKAVSRPIHLSSKFFQSTSTGLKYEVMRLSNKYPSEHLLECAQLLDEVLKTVVSDNTQVQKPTKPKEPPKRRLRKQVIEEDLQKAKAERQKKFAELEESRAKALAAKREQEKAFRAKQEREREKRQQQIQKWKEEKELKQQEETAKTQVTPQAREEAKKKANKEFIRKEQQRLRVQLKAIHEEKAKAREDKKKAEEDKLKLPPVKRVPGKSLDPRTKGSFSSADLRVKRVPTLAKSETSQQSGQLPRLDSKK